MKSCAYFKSAKPSHASYSAGYSPKHNPNSSRQSPRRQARRYKVGRPHKSFARINRIFPECIAKLNDEALSEEEKRQRALFIQFCLRVCEILATPRVPEKGSAR